MSPDPRLGFALESSLSWVIFDESKKKDMDQLLVGFLPEGWVQWRSTKSTPSLLPSVWVRMSGPQPPVFYSSDLFCCARLLAKAAITLVISCEYQGLTLQVQWHYYREPSLRNIFVTSVFLQRKCFSMASFTVTSISDLKFVWISNCLLEQTDLFIYLFIFIQEIKKVKIK